MTKKLLFLLTIFLLAYNNNSHAQQCSTGNNDLSGTQAGGFGRWSQSFQASCTGDLNNLKVFGSRDVSGITVTIYEGDGFSGNIMGSISSQSITQTTAYTDAEYSTFDLSSANISLIGGDTYTFDLSSGDFHYDETPSPNYNGGTLYFNTVPYTTFDVLFEVNIDSSTLGTNEFDSNLENIKIYQSNASEITIVGLNTKADINMYSLSGKHVLNKSVGVAKSNILSIPSINSGVYIVEVVSELGKTNKKIIFK
ncbi:T9SS type A sorting domain-containing protein [Algibacter miyuki]|uniref:T9SS type A sorting domain-containing protein n=1 Tax=Algibacter miyuki TaxID=1306933 RepID=A0ABV5H1E3_9FLAO|nr:T9SS type A sorting domain-containing protein [Algibacter miyuki]MDN3666334.1 T9SS type A sorting domain-containing protein [Algibacter miyuki]